MALITYKPRPKMHSWAPPSPPKPRRSRFYLCAVLGWLAATGVGYRWLSNDSEPNADDAQSAELPAPVSRQPPTTAERRSAGAVAVDPASNVDVQPAAPKANAEILACEEFLKEASEPSDNRLPAYLGRSALDTFIGENDWAKPCRTKHRRTAHLCIAIRDGAVRGLTVRTSPPNLTLENCLREQAAKLVLQPEATLRVIRTTLSL
jgi:hypothetical protein